jgi:predicted translin family RNA/ssDNA-binding protein
VDTRERVLQLQREIKELCGESEAYLKNGVHTPQETHAHEMCQKRLEQILDELIRLGK